MCPRDEFWLPTYLRYRREIKEGVHKLQTALQALKRSITGAHHDLESNKPHIRKQVGFLVDVELIFAIKISGQAVPRRHNEARKWHGRMLDLFTHNAQTRDECLEA